ncbi:hypothetical protein [Maricaulis parjimensis]|uniref:hypothetical protein n=1 Tax=Maricaulis parjimensis TaxID=144023 RepID=UPI0019396E5D|nr:hypothetical protein [Maricaulis parjimensis]
MKWMIKGVIVALVATVVSGCVSVGPLVRPGDPTGVIEIVNQAHGPIEIVTMSRCSASWYGPNRLPSGMVIPRGRSYRFTVSAGCWDVSAGTVGMGNATRRFDIRAGGGVRYTVTS